MGFAAVATGIAAVVAVPLALASVGPSMSEDAFLAAVRCTAYQDFDHADADLADARWRLNTEARLQPAAAAARAQAEVSDIARKAVNIESAADAAKLAQDRDAACLGAQIAAAADSSSAI